MFLFWSSPFVVLFASQMNRCRVTSIQVMHILNQRCLNLISNLLHHLIVRYWPPLDNFHSNIEISMSFVLFDNPISRLYCERPHVLLSECQITEVGIYKFLDIFRSLKSKIRPRIIIEFSHTFRIFTFETFSFCKV